jgi:hypothetical protein
MGLVPQVVYKNEGGAIAYDFLPVMVFIQKRLEKLG